MVNPKAWPRDVHEADIAYLVQSGRAKSLRQGLGLEVWGAKVYFRDRMTMRCTTVKGRKVCASNVCHSSRWTSSERVGVGGASRREPEGGMPIGYAC